MLWQRLSRTVAVNVSVWKTFYVSRRNAALRSYCAWAIEHVGGLKLKSTRDEYYSHQIHHRLHLSSVVAIAKEVLRRRISLRREFAPPKSKNEGVMGTICTT